MSIRTHLTAASAPAPGAAPSGHVTARASRPATYLTIAAIGAVTALAGIEHGIGEIRQGNHASPGLAFASWADSAAFTILGGEPALSVVPNLLLTGVLAIASSLGFLVCATAFAGRRYTGVALLLLSVVMLLVGAGYGPPVIGVILAIAATRARGGAPAHSRPIGSVRRGLAALWPWLLVLDLVAWFTLVPGVVLIDSAAGAGTVPSALVLGAIVAAFSFLALALSAAGAVDRLRIVRMSHSVAAPPASQ